MNTISIKNYKSVTLFLFIFIACFIASCSKKAVAIPDLALAASGTYRLTGASGTLTGGTVTLPANSPFTIILTRTNTNEVDFKVTTTSSTTIPNVKLTGTTSAINLSHSNSDGSLNGSISNGNLSFTFSFNGGLDTYTAVKI